MPAKTPPSGQAVTVPTAAAATPLPATPGPNDPTSQDTPLFAVARPPACDQPVCLWAGSNPNTPNAPEVTYSFAGSHTHMKMIKPEIVYTTSGVSHITADLGVEDGSDSGDSQWVFTGHVHADTARGQLRADTATVQVVDQQIASITAQGSPALFQHLPTNPLEPAASAVPTPTPPAAPAGAAQKSDLANLTVHGHAESITYDATHDQVIFSGSSWFTNGCDDIISQLVTYNIGAQTVEASGAPGSGARGRVHGTIRSTRPGTGTDCTAAAGTTPGGAAPATRASVAAAPSIATPRAVAPATVAPAGAAPATAAPAKP